MGSTDFWGISFAPSSFEQGPMPDDELERKLGLLEAAWRFFDDVAARVSPEMRRARAAAVAVATRSSATSCGWERADLVKRVGVRWPDPVVPTTPEGLRSHRDEYVAALRDYNAEGRMARGRNWTIALLLRHSAFHVLDHAWEMEDKDLS